MNREILFRGKRVDNGEWVYGYLFDDGYQNPRHVFVGSLIIDEYKGTACDEWDIKGIDFCDVKQNTICRYTGLTDKNGKKIWENDILMCHDNPVDLAKAVFGEFNVIEVESEEVIDSVIGWHYEVIPTDELSKCEPFCYSMPLTDTYIKLTEMEVVGNVYDNPELLEECNE